MQIDELKIELATLEDLKYIDSRQRKHSNEVGFLRLKDLEYLISRETVWIATLNDQEIGAIVCSGGKRKPLCFRSNLVEPEAWSNGIGKKLTQFLQESEYAELHGGIRVRTRQDITRQVAINNNVGGLVMATGKPASRGVPVEEWWLPKRVKSELTDA
jgi:hypothetical protein